MDEEVVVDLWNRAQSQGYTRSLEEFKVLLQNDQEVIDDSFSYAKSNGYPGGLEEFKVLITASGDVKKKRRISTYCGRGSYGIRYRRRDGSYWLIGCFRSRK